MKMVYSPRAMPIDFDFLQTVFLLPAMAFLVTLGAIPLVRKWAIETGFVDHPGGRKQHDGDVPPIGGVVVFSVFMAFSIFTESPFDGTWAFFLALTMVLLAGIADDARGVDARVKFSIHFLAAFIMVLGGEVRLENLGNLLGFGEMTLGWFSIPFSVACVVYIINAMNMMDGIDGLAAGKGLIILGWLMAACALGDWREPLTAMAIISGGLVGFLVYNLRHPFHKKASVFLGDAGSMALGLTIAWFAMGISQGPEPVVAPVSVAWIIALPIVDAFGLFVTRIREGKHPFMPDRRHFHHRFLDAGFSVGQSTFLILLWGGLLGAVGFFGVALGIPEGVLGWLWVALWVGHTALVMRPALLISGLAGLHRVLFSSPSTKQNSQTGEL